MVVAHEVFGHGARFRELGDGRIRYGFDAPDTIRLGRRVYEIQRPVSDLAACQLECLGCRHRRAARARRCDRRTRRRARTFALSRGVAVLRIAHGRRQLHAERISDVVRRARRCRFSRDLREGLHRTMLAAYAQLCSTPRAARACRSAAVLLDVRPGGLLHRQRKHDRSDAADSSGRRSAPDAVAGVRARAVRRQNGLFARHFSKSREPRAESDESRTSRCVWETPAPRRRGASARVRRMCCVCGDFASGWQSMSGGSRSCSPIKRLTLSTWAAALSQRSSCRSRESCDPDGRTAFRFRPATNRKASCRANSSRAAGSFARASRSGGEAASTEARRAKVDTMSAR